MSKPALMRWVEVAGKVFRAEVSGDGRLTLLLIHEMGGSLNSWDRVIPLLRPHFRILRYDLQGCGMSEAVRGTLDFGTVVRDAALLLDYFGLDGPVVPVGCAVGGAVALGFAAEFASRCASVVALAPATSVPEERRAALLARADAAETLGLREGIDASLMRGYAPALRAEPGIFEQTRAMRIAANPFGVAAMARLLAGLDIKAELGRIACPALVLAGEYDLDRPPENGSAVAAAIATSEFRIIPSGHFMAIQTPSLVAQHILSFLLPKAS
jgi:3-oxoadipate enol-lactonase